MALIKTVDPDQATGVIKLAFDMMKQLTGGTVPKPLLMRSASPNTFENNWQGMQYYMQHPTLSPILLACIRYATAASCEYPYCIEMNMKILTLMGGMTEAQARALIDDPGAANLNKKDEAMLGFVQKAMRTPEDVQQEDVDALRALGWSDPDMFDAVSHGAAMVSSGILFNTFKMGI